MAVKGGQTLLYVLMGEDDFSLHQKLEEIKKSLGDPTTLAANLSVLEGPQVTVDQLRAVAEALPFLAEKRLVIVNGLLGRFEDKTKSSRGKSVVSAPQSQYQPFAESLVKIPDSTVLVLVDGKIGSQNPLLKEISAKARVMTFPLLREGKLRKWIEKQVEAVGGKVSAGAVDLLVRFVGSNLWIMSNEIEKLALFTSGRRIEEEDVRRVVSYAQEANVFTLIDAILEFKVGQAEQLLRRLLQRGAVPAYLLVMLARQVHVIVRVRELKNQGKTKAEIQSRLDSVSEFVLSKALEQAERYSLARLKQVYHKLLEADLAIKTGKYDAELALNMLIAELYHQRPSLTVSSAYPKIE